MPDDRSMCRRDVLRCAGVAGTAGLAGCVESVPGLGRQPPDQEGGSAVTGWAWETVADALASTTGPYERQGPDVRIRRVDHAAMMERFLPALTAGSGAPDFSVLESVVAPSFIDTGGLADLSGRIGPDTKSEFVSGKWEAISRGDEVYAIPWDVGPVGSFYRRDTYSEHGIEADTIRTWDQFIEEGKKLPDGVYMNNLPPNDLDGVWRRQFRQLGGTPFTADGKVAVHSDESVEVAQTMKSMHDAGISNNVPSWGSDWFNLYSNGTIASLPAGAWMEGALKESLPSTSGKWGVYELPAHSKGGNHATNWGGANLCLPGQTPSDRAARSWDYMKWAMTSPEVQNGIYRDYGFFPAHEPAYDADLYDEPVSFFGGQRIRRIFADLARDIPGYRYTVDTPTVTDAMNEYLGRMLDGKLSPTRAVTRAAEEVASRTDREMA